ncbi:hypothetical protein HU200_029838 [Digitaria exilis]|uniref:AAA+ ATPase domain-containing protein n=1 Tax=Digitaria exilis TaxID=1010633 RepID=A0A835C1U5_9POAL|nr:hypothetical protein HU200_029838 [Digitaria exilis]CAB3497819.1 unnamed protein product [Digitaria exilis]
MAGTEAARWKGLRLTAIVTFLWRLFRRQLSRATRIVFPDDPHRLPITAAAGDQAPPPPSSTASGWHLTSAALMASQLLYLYTTLLSPALPLRHTFFGRHLTSRPLMRRLARLFDPYRTLTFDEYEGGGRMAGRSSAYEEIKAYLSVTCAASDAQHLRAEGATGRDGATDKLVLSMLDGEEISDELAGVGGATVWWRARSEAPPRSDGGGASGQEKRQLTIRYHGRYHGLVNDAYLPRIRQQGRELIVKRRQRKLFTNIRSVYTGSPWSHVAFEHPKTFATLAMDPARKKEIVDDLYTFKNGKEYYARVGKPWKRGYLLYGPPGTGKSTMIAAMANYLDYDIYDIELTTVRSNTELRKLLIETTRKSVIVIEDIDCSIDLTGERMKKKKKQAGDGNGGASTSATVDEDSSSSSSSTTSWMTLSGLLNVTDGLWSCCGEERIIVFTTNFVEKLDRALIRKGRMDRHIEMGYCGFEAFRSLAKMYHDVDAHRLFDDIGELLREVEMTTADVAEHLTPKSSEDNPDTCLEALVKALQEAAKEKANGGSEMNMQDGGQDDIDEQ